MELGKRQGYEVPYTTTAGGPGLMELIKKRQEKRKGAVAAEAAPAGGAPASDSKAAPKEQEMSK